MVVLRRHDRERRAAPRPARARFSGTGLEWIVNAYTLTFGGLLLLGAGPATSSAGGEYSSPA